MDSVLQLLDGHWVCIQLQVDFHALDELLEEGACLFLTVTAQRVGQSAINMHSEVRVLCEHRPRPKQHVLNKVHQKV